MKIVICINTAWNIFNFRKGLIAALLKDGHEVIALAPHDASAERLVSLGCKFVDMPMPNGGTNPVDDLRLLLRLRRFFRRERVDVLLSYTVKPNIYGAFAARAYGVPVISNVAGLGAVFISKSFVTLIVKSLYRAALRSAYCAFFQNASDRDLFLQAGLVSAAQARLVPGSGINLAEFQPQPEEKPARPFRFLLIGRMLRDKGVLEFVAAATQLAPKYPAVEFALLGATDYNNPAAISGSQVEEWVSNGQVIYLGTRDDVRTEIARADCVVLPSYREGTPRTLLEAAAMAKPIVTTDTAGCREVVADGVNGFLCRVADAQDLADKLERMLMLDPGARRAMGLAGRLKMQEEFDEQLVIEKYRLAIEGATAAPPRR